MFGFGKPPRPRAVAFDMIGTLFPLEPLRPAIQVLGLPPAGLEYWFATALRDAGALTATGRFQPFPAVLAAALDQVLAEQRLAAPPAAKAAVFQRLQTLPARPDAAEALRMLVAARVRIVALSNGDADATRALLQGARLGEMVDDVVTAGSVRAAKPHRAMYDAARKQAGLRASRIALIAAHAWDLQGAKAAGWTTAYLGAKTSFPPVMTKPDMIAATLPELITKLLR